ncbi:hypothetical protein D0869_09030 [Hortaea werneckii]|uniref:Rhodopsin domain-containing protein n=2 Tax=Hortaea werneckii TaxID=91943 RepID=A0A3M6ZI47_HORWE|nr:hypothetical protein D0869_09030 [Hortaea werneckii]RMY14821.1 hypothetical protein D0868_01243 [Hortaea werneckii]
MGFPPALPLDTGRASSIVICCIVFPCLAALTVVARFVARRQKAVKYGWDDYLVVLALLALCGQLTILILGTIYGGVGHHNARLSSENIAFQYKVKTLAVLARQHVLNSARYSQQSSSPSGRLSAS